MKKEITSILCAAALACSAGAANVTDFSDVRPSDWYHDAVNYVCENGLMNGTSDTAFSPNDTTSRGMIVTILYRLAGSPNMPESNWGYPYADVDAAAYYSTPVYWARMNDLVTGYSDDQFGPDDAITREQLTAILYRYADSLGLDTDTGFIPNKYCDFSDYQTVSRYASKAMNWCVNKGIVNGSGGRLNPQGTATRAEVATILMNAESILSGEEPAEPETPIAPDEQPVPEITPDDIGSENADDNQTITDEIAQRPTGQSARDEYGGYWDYDLSNATFDAVNNLREENGLPRLAYSLQVQEWADIRSRELWIVDERDGDISHTRPDGSVFATVGTGCNTENALINIVSANHQTNVNMWYGSQGHRENMLNTRSKTAAVSIYVQGEKVYALQLFDKLTVDELNNL
nr:S-layer homology domain-containing protein [uncultured Agathobaculum sp.]